jgi:hypothetical protein
MPETAASRPISRQASWPLFIVGTVVVLLLAGTIALWAHYGSTVFFEVIRTGLAACFG